MPRYYYGVANIVKPLINTRNRNLILRVILCKIICRFNVNSTCDGFVSCRFPAVIPIFFSYCFNLQLRLIISFTVQSFLSYLVFRDIKKRSCDTFIVKYTLYKKIAFAL